jgi:copper chaperone NosL
VVGIGLCGSETLLALTLKRKQSSPEDLFMPISDRERCPVCGMFVKPYPKWITQIQFRSGHQHSFDGVKCFFRFYFNPEKYDADVKPAVFERLLVRDYYTLRFISHDEAYYVIGSNVHGPMGHELIPFASRVSARTFMSDHQGLKIYRFQDITPDLLELLDKAKRTVVLEEEK